PSSSLLSSPSSPSAFPPPLPLSDPCDRLTGTTDRQAEADGVRPGRRAAVPSWDEIVFGTRRKKPE
ncbi:septation protein SepH, partial [Streptomyces celluloflavus]